MHIPHAAQLQTLTDGPCLKTPMPFRLLPHCYLGPAPPSPGLQGLSVGPVSHQPHPAKAIATFRSSAGVMSFVPWWLTPCGQHLLLSSTPSSSALGSGRPGSLPQLSGCRPFACVFLHLGHSQGCALSHPLLSSALTFFFPSFHTELSTSGPLPTYSSS